MGQGNFLLYFAERSATLRIMKITDALKMFPRVLTALNEFVPTPQLTALLSAELPDHVQERLDRIPADKVDLVSDAAVDFIAAMFHSFADFFNRIGVDLVLAWVGPVGECSTCTGAEVVSGAPNDSKERLH